MTSKNHGVNGGRDSRLKQASRAGVMLPSIVLLTNTTNGADEGTVLTVTASPVFRPMSKGSACTKPSPPTGQC